MSVFKKKISNEIYSGSKRVQIFRKHKLKFNSQDKIYAKLFPAKKWKLLIPSKNGSVGKNMKYSVARHPTRRCPDLARRLFKN